MLADRFELLAPIGSGPLGDVHRARDRRREGEVAVRVIDEPDRVRAQALLSVARRAAAVRHANVVAVLDCGQEGDKVWVAMEIVEGRTLAQTLVEEGPFAPERLARVGMELCAALDAGHRCGLVHRDLKPGNVMLTATGIKLMDFGLAHARARAGTAPYLSPEAAHGYPVDERSDLYSLGVLLVELALGAGYAFDHASDAPLALGDRVPAPLRSIMLRLLHNDPSARFHSAAAVADALRVAVAPARGLRSWRGRIIGAVIAVLGTLGVVALLRGRMPG